MLVSVEIVNTCLEMILYGSHRWGEAPSGRTVTAHVTLEIYVATVIDGTGTGKVDNRATHGLLYSSSVSLECFLGLLYG